MNASVVRLTMFPSPACAAINVAARRRAPALHREGDAGERVAQEFAAHALPGLAVDLLVLEQLADVREDRARRSPCPCRSGATRQNSRIDSAARRAMCTTQRLCSMKVTGQLGTRSVNGISSRSRGQGAQLERTDPRGEHLLAERAFSIQSISARDFSTASRHDGLPVDGVL